MIKAIRDRVNAIRSQLADLRRPKMGKSYFDLTRIKELEDELKILQMNIVSIERVNTAIFIRLGNGEHASFYKFGDTIYTTVSENLNKSSLDEFKKDIVSTGWDVEKLRELYVH